MTPPVELQIFKCDATAAGDVLLRSAALHFKSNCVSTAQTDSPSEKNNREKLSVRLHRFTHRTHSARHLVKSSVTSRRKCAFGSRRPRLFVCVLKHAAPCPGRSIHVQMFVPVRTCQSLPGERLLIGFLKPKQMAPTVAAGLRLPWSPQDAQVSSPVMRRTMLILIVSSLYEISWRFVRVTCVVQFVFLFIPEQGAQAASICPPGCS